MSGWETFDRLCRSMNLEADIKALKDQPLHDLRETLDRVQPDSGVPALIDGLATLEAACRWQGGGR
jgi:hypothetical protein